VEWRAYWQLDDALLGNAAALEEAARTLPGAKCCSLALLRIPQTLHDACADPELPSNTVTQIS
jgi:hypothetical protein